MKKHVCLNCGKKIPTDRKYCSIKCNKTYHRREIYRQTHGSCLYNEDVICHQRACSKCGWNPQVQQERIDKILGGKK